MSDKAKHRSNTRHCLLMQISIMLVLVGAIAAGLIISLQPAGEQIIFMGPDEHYVRKLWIADLNHPAQPRPLTSGPIFIFQVVDDERVIYIEQATSGGDAIMWLLHVRTGERQQLMTCDGACWVADVHSNGRWVAYATNQAISVIDLQTLQQYHPEAPQVRMFDENTVPQWIGDSGRLFLGGISIYDMESGQLTQEWLWYPARRIPYFSPDGQYFAVDSGLYGDTFTIHSYANPAEALFTFPDSQAEGHTFFHTWHPDSTKVLITESARGNNGGWEYSLNLLNILTGERTILMPRDAVFERYPDTFQFNADGTKLLYEVPSDYRATNWRYNKINRFMVLDLETGVHTALPLFGTPPRWFDGGAIQPIYFHW